MIPHFSELDKYFNIIIADKNPFILKTSEVFKRNNRVEYSSKEEIYNLNKYQLSKLNISCIKSTIFNIISECDVKELKLSKNIFKKLFRSNNKFISREIKLESKNFIITSEEMSRKYFKDFKGDLFLEDIDTIIIGEKTNLIIRYLSNNEIELFFDKENFKNYIIS